MILVVATNLMIIKNMKKIFIRRNH